MKFKLILKEEKFHPNFHIQKIALNIFNQIKKIDFKAYKLMASPLYNGREKGIALKVLRNQTNDGILVINFGKERDSEKIFVTIGLSVGHHSEPASMDDISDDMYKKRKLYELSDTEKAVELINFHINKFLTTNDYNYLPKSDNYNNLNENKSLSLIGILKKI